MCVCAVRQKTACHNALTDRPTDAVSAPLPHKRPYRCMYSICVDRRIQHTHSSWRPLRSTRGGINGTRTFIDTYCHYGGACRISPLTTAYTTHAHADYTHTYTGVRALHVYRTQERTKKKNIPQTLRMVSPFVRWGDAFTHAYVLRYMYVYSCVQRRTFGREFVDSLRYQFHGIFCFYTFRFFFALSLSLLLLYAVLPRYFHVGGESPFHGCTFLMLLASSALFFSCLVVN